MYFNVFICLWKQRYKVGDFYNGGLWEKFLIFVGSSWHFVSGCIKNVDTHNEVSVQKKTSNEKVIAKNPLTNLYEMNSNSTFISFLKPKSRPCCYINWMCSSIEYWFIPNARVFINRFLITYVTSSAKTCLIEGQISLVLVRHHAQCAASD